MRARAHAACTHPPCKNKKRHSWNLQAAAAASWSAALPTASVMLGAYVRGLAFPQRETPYANIWGLCRGCLPTAENSMKLCVILQGSLSRECFHCLLGKFSLARIRGYQVRSKDSWLYLPNEGSLASRKPPLRFEPWTNRLQVWTYWVSFGPLREGASAQPASSTDSLGPQ